MTVGWVAAATRGRAMTHGLLGPEVAGELVGRPWSDVADALRETTYGHQMPLDASRPQARSAALAATTWQMRVLAGWLPPGGSGLARAAAAPIEIVCIDGHLRHLLGGAPGESVNLGNLATAWPRAASTADPDELRRVLATSAWGDPGSVEPVSVGTYLRLAWLLRAARAAPVTSDWTRGLAAVLVARERYVFERDLAASSARLVRELLGSRATKHSYLSDFVRSLGPGERWPFDDVDGAETAWRAEVAVGRRIEHDAGEIALGSRPGPRRVAAVFATLLIDLWRTLVVMEVAGLGPAERVRDDLV